MNTDSQLSQNESARNPAEFDDIERAYSAGYVLVASLATIALTGAGQLVTWFAHGQLGPDENFGFTICWGLGLSTVPLLWWTRHAVLHSTTRRLPLIYWAQSMMQNTWLAVLAWYVTPPYVPVLFFVLCLFLFNDSRTFYHSAALKTLYGSMWLGQIVVLLLVDVAGGPGLLALLRSDPKHAAVVLIVELCVALLSLTIVHIVGKGHQERDQAASRNAQLEAALLAIRTERGVLARSCDFLLQGLSAGRFSHDVASPISVLGIEIARLRAMLDERLSSQSDARCTQCLDRIESAVEQTQSLTRALARSLRDPADPVETRLSELVQEALRHAMTSLQRHSVPAQQPSIAVEDCSVVVSAEHAAAIGNVMVNGMLRAPNQSLEITATRATDRFSRLSIRDWGVAPEEREQALTTVEAHMSLQLDSAAAVRTGSYDGYGVALLLTKALVVRWGGWMAATSPENGAGLRFDIVLPCVPTNEIPDELNRPEEVLRSSLRARA